MAKTADVDDRGIIAPDSTPPFPYEMEGVSKSDMTKLAEAAWEQSHGSIAAFNQLTREHANGTIDLLDLKANRPETDPRRQGARPPAAPSSLMPMLMAGTNDAIAADRRASEADRVVAGENIQGPAPVARAEAEADAARASRARASAEVAATAVRTAAEAEVRETAAARGVRETAAARTTGAEARVVDGKRTE